MSDVPRTRSPWSPAAVGMVALMAFGSAMMWIGLPLGLIYLASQVADSSQPSLGPYMIVIVGLPIGMTLIGKGLATLGRRYDRTVGEADDRIQRAAWLKSMRAERGSTRQRSVLDVVMVISVSFCLICMAIWFLAFAGSSLPGT